MKRRILCLCLVLVLWLCGCGSDHTPADVGTTTNTTHITTTTVANAISTDTTDTHTATSTTSDTKHSVATAPGTPITVNTENPTKDNTIATTTHKPSAEHPSVTTTIAETVTFKATIRDSVRKLPVSGVTVTVLVDDGSSPAGIAVTDGSGMARITLQKGNVYRVLLDTLPAGYEADSEYRFMSNTVNITIRPSATQNEADHSSAGYEVGSTIGNFTLTDIHGKTYRFSELQAENKLIILDFWFINCPFCVKEFPLFETVTQTYSDDVLLLAVNPFDRGSAIQTFLNEYNVETNIDLTFPLLQDTCNLYRGFNVTAYPTTVFISADGVIRNIHIGAFPTIEALTSEIQKYIG